MAGPDAFATADYGGIEAQSLLIARVRDMDLHPALSLAAAASLRDAALAMRERDLSCVLVEDPSAGPGIVTGTDLRDALALAGLAPDAPLGPLARRPLIGIDGGELLLDALIAMGRHGVKRLIVMENGAPSGVLDQGDVLGYLAKHSHAVLLLAQQAQRPEELAPAFRSLVTLVGVLQRNGMKPDRIAQVASDVNRALVRRVFELVFPAEVHDRLCLVVLGSEGRGEQVLPTDQDNALIRADGFSHPELPAWCRAFTEAMVAVGYPPCPGNVMVSNPYWVLEESAFRERVRRWVLGRSSEDVMNLAIFFDATAVAGESAMLERVRGYLFEELEGGDAFYARFADAVNAFPIPVGLFARLKVAKQGTIDIKKGGIFPLVHGVRTLALEKRVAATGTLARMARLVELGTLERPFSRELAEAFEVLSSLRTDFGLAALEEGGTPDNLVRPDLLTELDRERLRETLRVVARFRNLIRHHFRLDILGF